MDVLVHPAAQGISGRTRGDGDALQPHPRRRGRFRSTSRTPESAPRRFSRHSRSVRSGRSDEPASRGSGATRRARDDLWDHWAEGRVDDPMAGVTSLRREDLVLLGELATTCEITGRRVVSMTRWAVSGWCSDSPSRAWWSD